MATISLGAAITLIFISTALVSLTTTISSFINAHFASQLRLFYILPALHRTRPPPRKRGTPTHLLIVLGSGGHTAEMFLLIANLDPKTYTHRSYVVGSGDDFSSGKATEFEREIARGIPREEAQSDLAEDECGYSIHTVPRARQIHQSLLTSPFSTLKCLYACLLLLVRHPRGKPDLILTNGPATSLIVILASTILRYFALLSSFSQPGFRNVHFASRGTRIVYVESWARVRRPSLSGRIIVWCGLCNRVLVQWKALETSGWGEYRGALVR